MITDLAALTMIGLLKCSSGRSCSQTRTLSSCFAISRILSTCFFSIKIKDGKQKKGLAQDKAKWENTGMGKRYKLATTKTIKS